MSIVNTRLKILENERENKESEGEKKFRNAGIQVKLGSWRGRCRRRRVLRSSLQLPHLEHPQLLFGDSEVEAVRGDVEVLTVGEKLLLVVDSLST